MKFKDVEFMSAVEKELAVKQFRTFIESIVKNLTEAQQLRRFTKRLYQHLSLHCGFIAHYNREGFFYTYFNGRIEDLERFLKHFTNKGVAYWTSDFDDINDAMSRIVDEHLARLLSVAREESRGQDINMILTLMSRHSITPKELSRIMSREILKREGRIA